MTEIVIRGPQTWCPHRIPLAEITVDGVPLPLGDALYRDQRGAWIEHVDGTSTYLDRPTITYVDGDL